MSSRHSPKPDQWAAPDFRQLVECAPDAMLLIDGNGCIVYANGQAESVFGYTGDELRTRVVEDLVPTRFRAGHAEHRRQFHQDPRVRPMGTGVTLYGLRKDGSEFPVEISLAPIQSADGVLIASSIRDVTQRKQAEEALEQARGDLDASRLLTTLLGNLPGMVYRCRNDEAWTMEFVSEGSLQLLGYSPTELLDGKVTMGGHVIHPEDRGRLWNEVQAALLKQQPFELEYRVSTASDQQKWVWERGIGVYSGDGEVLGLEGFITDITERTLTGQALRLSERQYAALARLSPVGIFRTDPAGQCIYVNQRWCELSGLTAEEALGEGWGRAVHPDDRERVGRTWRETVKAGLPFEVEYRSLRPDGQVLPLWAQVARETDEEGELLGYVGTVTDLTAQKEAARKLQEAERWAQQRARLADAGAITTKILHDLGNPLAGLMMQAQIIQRSAQKGDDVAEVAEPAAQILTTTRHLDTMLKGFRQFAREQQLDLCLLPLDSFLEDLVEHWRPVAGRHRVDLHLEIADGSSAIHADESKLRRVLDNLIKNALEAISKGPGQVTVSVELVEDTRVQISVADTGPGVPEDVDVFRLFETTKADGTGLGVPVSRQLILAHAGDLMHEPAQPHGAIFQIVLPVRSPFWSGD